MTGAPVVHKHTAKSLVRSHPAPTPLVPSKPYAAKESLRDAFVVTPIQDKGHGVVAVRDIALGERLLVDAPLTEFEGKWQDSQTSIKPPLADALAALGPEGRRRFFALSQDESRFGTEKTALGVFATNGIPYLRGKVPCISIFATGARFNHSCAPNAVYRWNTNLNALTVHACQPIAAGDEICVYYGFDGHVTRSARQTRLKSSFGFDCTCAKCRLSGRALRESEDRLAIIGNDGSARRILEDWTGLMDLLNGEAPAVLARLESRFRLIKQECPDGHYPGLECFLLAFVQICDSAVAALTDVLERWPRPFEEFSRAAVGLTVGEPGAKQLVHVSRFEVHSKLATYADAARRWATLARDVTRDVEGNDSPAYHVWCEAAGDQGCWSHSSNSCRTFIQLWREAGLSIG